MAVKPFVAAGIVDLLFSPEIPMLVLYPPLESDCRFLAEQGPPAMRKLKGVHDD